MTLVTEQAKVCQRLVPARGARLPGARRAVRRPHLPDRPGGAPDRAHRAGRAGAGGRRPSPTPTGARVADGSGEAKAERLQAAAADSIAVPELDAEVAFEVGLLLDQFDLLERQIEAAEARVAALLDGELARRLQTIPGVGPATVRGAHRRDRRHRPVRRLRPAARLRRRPSRRAQLGPQGREPRDRLAHVQGRQQPPPRGRLPDGRRGRPATTRSSPPTTPASARPARAR